MGKYKIKANKDQLDSIGISYDITGLIGTLTREWPTGWYEIEVKHKIGDMEFTNKFDIPQTFLKQIKK